MENRDSDNPTDSQYDLLNSENKHSRQQNAGGMDEEEAYQDEDDGKLIDDEDMDVGFSHELHTGSLSGEINALEAEAEAQGPSEQQQLQAQNPNLPPQMFIKQRKTTSSAKRSSPNKRSNMSGKGLFDAASLEAKTQGSLSTNISR